MDPATDINQDPVAAGDSGATSFAPDFDMSAINDAVAAGGTAENIQNSFDVNDISLDDTPTTDSDLQKQLTDNPNMSLANSDSATNAPASEPAAPEAAGFVDGDLVDTPAAPAEETTASADPFTSDSAAPVADPAPVEETPAAEPAPVEETPAADQALVETVAPAEGIAEAAPTEEASAEPATVADLANAASADLSAPEATPSADIAQAQATPAPTAEKKSKLPTYVLIGLSLVAIVAVIIAVIVSLGK